MKLVKPVRSPGELTVNFVSRRDSYRISMLEEQIKLILNDVKKLKGVKK